MSQAGQPRVSIVMPVYNGARFLPAAVRSALAQTYANIEIILVNDGSTDGGRTHALCAGYAEAHPDKVVYIRQENTGVAGALNAGIAAMTGDFFSWLSHDDGYLRRKVERQVEFHRVLGDPDAVVFSDFNLIGESGELIQEVKLARDKPRVTGLWPVLFECINGCTLLIPADVIRAAGPFDVRYRYVQDYRLWWSMIRDHGFHHMPETLVNQRVHSAQETHKPGAIEEGEAFWRDAVSDCTPVERAQASGSSLRFYEDIGLQLASGRFPKALAAARAATAGCVAGTLVTVVLVDDGSDDALARSLKSVSAQTHPAWELIIAASPGRSDEVRRLAVDDARVSVEPLETPGLLEAVRLAVEQGGGEYVAPLGAGDVFEPRKLEIQLAQTMRSGRWISHTSQRAGEADHETSAVSGDVRPAQVSESVVNPSTLLIHRAAVEHGAFEGEAGETGLIPSLRRFVRSRPILGLGQVLTRTAA